jgi:hypothetical protein
MAAVEEDCVLYHPDFNWLSDRAYALEGLKQFAHDDVLRLLKGQHAEGAVFSPFIWDDPSRIVPVAHRSPAATLMRNAVFAPEGERVADKLRSITEENAALIVRYYEQKVREFDLASRRSEDR